MSCVLVCPAAVRRKKRSERAEKKVDCNFKIALHRHKLFKIVAAKQEISMVELFNRAFDEYVERHKVELIH